MVKKIVFIFWICCIFVVATDVSAQDSLSKKEVKIKRRQEVVENIIEHIEKDSVFFVADWIHPIGWQSINLISNPNYLLLKNDSALAHFPYYGRAYQYFPGSGGGINFENVYLIKQVKKNYKKGTVILKFIVNGEHDIYRCTLLIFENGTASLIVNSNYLQTITYSGQVQDWED